MTSCSTVPEAMRSAFERRRTQAERKRSAQTDDVRLQLNRNEDEGAIVPYGSLEVEHGAPPGASPEPAARGRPIFVALAMLSCTVIFLLQIRANGWKFQPMTCPKMCDGRPCNDDGSTCEANLLLGPTIEVLNSMGAKNDVAIFEGREWWRVITCNWLHAGLLHLAFNMFALFQLGRDLERVFGFWRIALLYVSSGLFGTILSVVFLPGVLSVGASASVFGVLGANWADVIVNYCARYTLRGSGICGLLVSTIINICFGFTPWVDNFMHLGGLLAGLTVGLTLMARKRLDVQSGTVRRTRCQEAIAMSSVLLAIVLGGIAVVAMGSDNVRSQFRSCSFCTLINCVPTDWWSCCATAVGGSCQIMQPTSANSTGTDTIQVMCNMTNAASFSASCSPNDNAACRYVPSDPASTQALCSMLCVGQC